MEIKKAEEWQFRALSDGCGVVYNPFSGDLHALSQLSSMLFEIASTDRIALEKVVDILMKSFPEVDRKVLLQQSELYVSSMIELGIFSTLADSNNTTSVF